MNACPRAEEETLTRFAAGLPLEPHAETCAECQAALKSYAAVAGALHQARTAYAPSGNWEAKVWARIQRGEGERRRTRWPAWAGLAAAFAALALLFLQPERGPEALSVTSSQLERGPGVLVRGAPGGEAQSAAPGDVLHMVVSVPRRQVGDIRVYRGTNELIFECARSPACVRSKDGLEARIPLDRAGTYRTLVLSTDHTLPPASGNLDADYAAAMRAGSAKESAPIDVL